MKEKTMKGFTRKHPLVDVVWEDHAADKEDSWTVKTEAHELKPELVHSVGHLVTENRQMIEIMRDVGYAPDDADSGGPIRIIKKCIIHYKILAK